MYRIYFQEGIGRIDSNNIRTVSALGVGKLVADATRLNHDTRFASHSARARVLQMIIEKHDRVWYLRTKTLILYRKG